MGNIKLLERTDAPLWDKYPCVAFQVGRYLKVFAYENRQNMGEAASYALSHNMRRLVDENGVISTVWAAAPSQDDVIANLVEDNNVPWDKVVNIGMMDEYAGLPESDKRSFRYYQNTHLLSPLSNFKRKFDRAAVRQIKGDSGQPSHVLEEYEKIICDHPPHVVQGGIGQVNAHIAFNDPPKARFDDPLLIKIIDIAMAAKRQQVIEDHYKSTSDIPPAFTQSIPALTRFEYNPGQEHTVGYWSCVAPTKEKATAVKKMVLGGITEKVPGTILRTLPNAALFLDLDSARLLHGNEGIDLKPIGYG